MAGCKWPQGVTGMIPKGTECEYNIKCSKSGVRCEQKIDMNYTCGYCQAFRMIDILNAEKAAKALAEEKKDV